MTNENRPHLKSPSGIEHTDVKPLRWFQFSLRTLMKVSVLASVAIYTVFHLRDASAMEFLIVVIIMIVLLPFVFIAEIMDWLLGVKRK